MRMQLGGGFIVSSLMATKWRSRKRLWLIGSTVLVVLVVLFLVFGRSGDKRTAVQTDVAVAENITELVNASGRIQPQTKVNIVAEVSAEIRKLYVREGERVSKGQPLLLLDTVQLKSDVAQSRYSLEELTSHTASAQAEQERDRLEAERQEKLFAQKLTSETAHSNAKLAYERSKAEFEAMEAQVKTGRARLEKTIDNLRKTQIVAPMDGIVTLLNAEVGEISQAQTSFTQGQTLMTIADLSVFEVEVDVDETEVAKVHVGQKARIRVDAFRDTSFAGDVVEVGNSATISGQGTESYTTSFRVKVRFSDMSPAVRPGMSASVDITTASAEDALLVPYAAVVTREFDPDSLKKAEKPVSESGAVAAVAAPNPGDTSAKPAGKKSKKIRKTGVFVVKEGKANFREVTTGIADERNIAVHSGVAVGDTIISGSFQTLRRLKDGELVKVDNPTPGGPEKKAM
ncbi:MAG: efflux RND transporter periplasmic adaptor subunit [candidate division Zixibacteria bacterium]|nr:efflux RND transporter periplasmic adaptor subunit [candidate division Zixibacteria bacterium]